MHISAAATAAAMATSFFSLALAAPFPPRSDESTDPRSCLERYRGHCVSPPHRPAMPPHFLVSRPPFQVNHTEGLDASASSLAGPLSPSASEAPLAATPHSEPWRPGPHHPPNIDNNHISSDPSKPLPPLPPTRIPLRPPTRRQAARHFCYTDLWASGLLHPYEAGNQLCTPDIPSFQYLNSQLGDCKFTYHPLPNCQKGTGDFAFKIPPKQGPCMPVPWGKKLLRYHSASLLCPDKNEGTVVDPATGRLRVSGEVEDEEARREDEWWDDGQRRHDHEMGEDADGEEMEGYEKGLRGEMEGLRNGTIQEGGGKGGGESGEDEVGKLLGLEGKTGGLGEENGCDGKCVRT